MPGISNCAPEWKDVLDLNLITKEDEKEFIRRNLQKNKLKKDLKFIQVSDLLTASSLCDEKSP